MRELDIDIAVDLAGFTTGARTGILAARCAPVQVNFLGFPSTMGTRFMDYLVADDVVLPASDEAAYSERVLRLPHCYLPSDCTRVIPAGAADRAVAGLPAQGFVFCGFNNSYKITRDLFQVWLSLLREVSDSVLWLRNMSADAMESLRRAADELGVARSRLIFAAHTERMDDYLARLRLADLFLDTLPYNAHTTAADALWAGGPCRELPGKLVRGPRWREPPHSRGPVRSRLQQRGRIPDQGAPPRHPTRRTEHPAGSAVVSPIGAGFRHTAVHPQPGSPVCHDVATGSKIK